MLSFLYSMFLLFEAAYAAFELFLLSIPIIVIIIVLIVCQARKNRSKKKELNEFSKYQIYCRNCGRALNGSQICKGCGVRPGTGNKFCFRCGNRVDPLAVVCVKCGVSLSDAHLAKKSKVVAGLLGIFLGYFGVHNFYLGYMIKAFAQVILAVFCIFNGIAWGVFIAVIWGAIEGIMILAGGIKVDGKGIPLKD